MDLAGLAPARDDQQPTYQWPPVPLDPTTEETSRAAGGGGEQLGDSTETDRAGPLRVIIGDVWLPDRTRPVRSVSERKPVARSSNRSRHAVRKPPRRDARRRHALRATMTPTSPVSYPVLNPHPGRTEASPAADAPIPAGPAAAHVSRRRHRFASSGHFSSYFFGPYLRFSSTKSSAAAESPIR